MIWNRESKMEYRFMLYFDEGDAKKDFSYRLYGFTTPPVKRPVFCKGKIESREYYVSYIERDRSGPGGWCLPMDYYTQIAVFRLSNLVIEIEARSKKKSNDMLSASVEYVANLLNNHLREQ